MGPQADRIELGDYSGEVEPDLKIYGTLHFAMGIESRGSHWEHYEGVCMVSPLLDRVYHAGLPDSRSAYIYDAFNLVIHAIRQVGTDREEIIHYLSEMEYSGGTTGNISFDELGNRLGDPPLCRIENGIPHLLH